MLDENGQKQLRNDMKYNKTAVNDWEMVRHTVNSHKQPEVIRKYHKMARNDQETVKQSETMGKLHKQFQND